MKKTAKIFFGLLDKKKQSNQMDMKIQTLMSKGKLPQPIRGLTPHK